MAEKIKTSKELDGKQVHRVWLSDGEESQFFGVYKAIYHYEYHGEYDDAWIVVYKNGIESQRFNTRYLEGIEWVTEQEVKDGQ